jgi:GNAT superfamily N-acetyltransferase
MLTLRAPRIDELAQASELCLRSKAHWDYPDDFLAACTSELTLTQVDLDTTEVILAIRDGKMVGVAQIGMDDGECYLEKLFVDPNDMGAGTGKALFEWSKDIAAGLGAAEMVVEADPDAVGFYERMGCTHAGETASGSIPGRKIPRLTFAVRCNRG